MTLTRFFGIKLVLVFLAFFPSLLQAGNDHAGIPRRSRIIYTDTLAKKDSADTVKTIKHRKFTPGVAWASNNTYHGRKDSVDHYLISPSFSYEGKYGFNASITASHTSLPPATNNYGKPVKTKKTPVLDEYDVAAGYDHDWNDQFSSSILETHNFFDVQSSRLKTTIDNDLTLGSNYDGKYITIDLTGDWAHGKKNKNGETKDYFYTLTLSHQFSFEKLFHSSWEFDIEPKVDAVYGTQNFYKSYTKGVPLDKNVKQAEYEKQLSTYNLLNAEFKLPLTLTNDKWSLSPEWDYEVPMSTPSGAPSLPFSVYSVSLTYTFTSKK
jgi:hypothetical protein